ncbi:Hypothetical predicted protein [Olea europaea subsp. europaea]|uniref:Uncharacterized protein n=1 Tax=Olea europaea subsp. europaea TaxID=158383 RepID=A0A8S0VN99_OLEEU|nr:Hypothetical predicted protein [Olea europaea subsp. europaea]
MTPFQAPIAQQVGHVYIGAFIFRESQRVTAMKTRMNLIIAAMKVAAASLSAHLNIGRSTSGIPIPSELDSSAIALKISLLTYGQERVDSDEDEDESNGLENEFDYNCNERRESRRVMAMKMRMNLMIWRMNLIITATKEGIHSILQQHLSQLTLTLAKVLLESV